MKTSVKQGQNSKSNGVIIGDKREAILRAAIKVFAQKGYFNSKVADIAGAAGIADGTVYLYFKSKEEILHSVFDRAMEEFIAEGKREIAAIESAENRLRKIAELHLERLGADRDLAIVFQVELRGSTKFMEEFSGGGFADYLEIIRQTIEDGQKDGTFRQDLADYGCQNSLRRTRRNGDELDFIEKRISARADGGRSSQNIFRRSYKVIPDFRFQMVLS